MTKPNVAAIRAAEPLSKAWTRGYEPNAGHCNLCRMPSADLTVWREHDERDKPIAGCVALVFIGRDHAECLRRMNEHPRLYAEETGRPGHFPRLCGGCPWRRGWDCTHPKLKANGGPGLNVRLAGLAPGAIICTRGGGCVRPLVRAMKCEALDQTPETP